MWTIGELKERAKMALTGSYWKAFGVSLILAFLTGGNGGGTGSFSNMNQGGAETNPAMLGIIIIIVIIILVLSIAFSLFVSGPIEVGGKRYFIHAAELGDSSEQADFGLIGYAFNKGYYMPVVKSMFLRNLYMFLWTLLGLITLFIPTIMKGYAYAMVPYILADNPEIGASRAIELSNEMTKGEKLDMFILDLSFLGWWILGLLACCIGLLFVAPYYNATHAELYRVLREKALEEDLCSYQELGFQKPSNPEVESVDDEIRF